MLWCVLVVCARSVPEDIQYLHERHCSIRLKQFLMYICIVLVKIDIVWLDVAMNPSDNLYNLQQCNKHYGSQISVDRTRQHW